MKFSFHNLSPPRPNSPITLVMNGAVSRPKSKSHYGDSSKSSPDAVRFVTNGVSLLGIQSFMPGHLPLGLSFRCSNVFITENEVMKLANPSQRRKTLRSLYRLCLFLLFLLCLRISSLPESTSRGGQTTICNSPSLQIAVLTLNRARSLQRLLNSLTEATLGAQRWICS